MTGIGRLGAVIVLVCGAARAGAEPLPPEKQTRLGLYLTATETAAFLEARPEAVMIDVRTPGEIDQTGLAEGTDALIPLSLPDRVRGAVANPDFLPGLAAFARDRELDRDSPIVVICRSGNRSAHTANILAQLGFTQVYTVTDGYEGDRDGQGRRSVNGWKNAGLPWETRPASSCAPAAQGGAC